jgi:5-methylcytosine-specific restriction endonuclease McrA
LVKIERRNRYLEQQKSIVVDFSIADYKSFGNGIVVRYPYLGRLSVEERCTKEYCEWREKVLARDNHECTVCGSENRLHVHHIESYSDNPKLRTEISNGVVLCYDCHIKFHDKYGRGGNTKGQLEEWINDG